MTSELPLKTSLLFNTTHVGNHVEINNRIRWVKFPASADPKNKIRPPEIIWWPCILYKSFEELGNDLDIRLVEFRRRCKVADSKIELSKSAVAYLLGFSTPIVRIVKNYSCPPVPKQGEDTFRLDIEGRSTELKDFYDFFLESQDIASASQASNQLKAKFQESLALAEDILAAENDLSAKFEMPKIDERWDELLDDAVAKVQNNAVSLVGTGKEGKIEDIARSINLDLDSETANKTEMAILNDNVNPQPKNIDCPRLSNNAAENKPKVSTKKTRLSMTSYEETNASQILPRAVSNVCFHPKEIEKTKKYVDTTTKVSCVQYATLSPVSCDSVMVEDDAKPFETVTVEADDDDEPSDSETKFWRQKEKEGWRKDPASKYNNNKLHEWYYIPPEKDPSNQNQIHGVHYFSSIEDVKNHCDSANIRDYTALSPVSIDSVMAKDDDKPIEIVTIEGEDDDGSCDSEADFWRQKEKEGWKKDPAAKYNTNKLHEWYYIPPMKDPGSQNQIHGIHYFSSIEDAKRHCAKLEKALVKSKKKRSKDDHNISKRNESVKSIDEAPNKRSRKCHNINKGQADGSTVKIPITNKTSEIKKRKAFTKEKPVSESDATAKKQTPWNVTQEKKLKTDSEGKIAKGVKGTLIKGQTPKKFNHMQKSKLESKRAKLTYNDDAFCKDKAPNASDRTAEIIFDEIFWWMNYPIPHFAKVWKTLQKLMFTYASYKYFLPGCKNLDRKQRSNTNTFEDVPCMRKHLCKEGIPMGCTESQNNISPAELTQLVRWISLAHLPTKYEGSFIQYETSPEFFTSMEITPLSDEDALSILLLVGQTKLKLEPHHIEIDREENSMEGVKVKIRSLGIPNTWCLSDKNHVALILWSSLSQLPLNNLLRTEKQKDSVFEEIVVIDLSTNEKSDTVSVQSKIQDIENDDGEPQVADVPESKKVHNNSVRNEIEKEKFVSVNVCEETPMSTEKDHSINMMPLIITIQSKEKNNTISCAENTETMTQFPNTREDTSNSCTKESKDSNLHSEVLCNGMQTEATQRDKIMQTNNIIMDVGHDPAIVSSLRPTISVGSTTVENKNSAAKNLDNNDSQRKGVIDSTVNHIINHPIMCPNISENMPVNRRVSQTDLANKKTNDTVPVSRKLYIASDTCNGRSISKDHLTNVSPLTERQQSEEVDNTIPYVESTESMTKPKATAEDASNSNTNESKDANLLSEVLCNGTQTEVTLRDKIRQTTIVNTIIRVPADGDSTTVENQNRASTNLHSTYSQMRRVRDSTVENAINLPAMCLKENENMSIRVLQTDLDNTKMNDTVPVSKKSNIENEKDKTMEKRPTPSNCTQMCPHYDVDPIPDENENQIFSMCNDNTNSITTTNKDVTASKSCEEKIPDSQEKSAYESEGSTLTLRSFPQNNSICAKIADVKSYTSHTLMLTPEEAPPKSGGIGLHTTDSSHPAGTNSHFRTPSSSLEISGNEYTAEDSPHFHTPSGELIVSENEYEKDLNHLKPIVRKYLTDAALSTEFEAQEKSDSLVNAICIRDDAPEVSNDISNLPQRTVPVNFKAYAQSINTHESEHLMYGNNSAISVTDSSTRKKSTHDIGATLATSHSTQVADKNVCMLGLTHPKKNVREKTAIQNICGAMGTRFLQTLVTGCFESSALPSRRSDTLSPEKIDMGESVQGNVYTSVSSYLMDNGVDTDEDNGDQHATWLTQPSSSNIDEQPSLHECQRPELQNTAVYTNTSLNSGESKDTSFWQHSLPSEGSDVMIDSRENVQNTSRSLTFNPLGNNFGNDRINKDEVGGVAHLLSSLD